MDVLIISAISTASIVTILIVVVCAWCIRRNRRKGKCKCRWFDYQKFVKRLKLALRLSSSRRYSREELRKLSSASKNNNQKLVPQLPAHIPYGTVTEHHLQIETTESIESYTEHELPEVELYNCDEADESCDSVEEVTPLPSEESPENSRSRSFRKLSNSLSPRSRLGRSKSAGEAVIRKSLTSQGLIKYCVSYHERERKLLVDVKTLTKLNVESSTDSVYVRVHLLPKETDFQQTKAVTCNSEYTEFNHEFEFVGFSNEDTTKDYLRLVVYGKEPGKTRDRFIGEVFCQLSEISALSETPTTCIEELKPSRLKKKSTSDKFLFQELGQLFLHLQYQPLAQRMKVVVRRGENFPKGGQKFNVVCPDHYITINLLRQKEVLRSKHTRSQNGFSPVWNEAFLFDLPTDKHLSEYSFNFIVMRGKLYKKDDIIGHVTIGANTTKTGIAHWDEALMPRGLETARWHDITPVITY